MRAARGLTILFAVWASAAQAQVVVPQRLSPNEAHGQVVVTSREPLALLDLSPDYVRRNLRLIAADAFHLDDAEAAARLSLPH